MPLTNPEAGTVGGFEELPHTNPAHKERTI